MAALAMTHVEQAAVGQYVFDLEPPRLIDAQPRPVANRRERSVRDALDRRQYECGQQSLVRGRWSMDSMLISPIAARRAS